MYVFGVLAFLEAENAEKHWKKPKNRSETKSSPPRIVVCWCLVPVLVSRSSSGGLDVYSVDFQNLDCGWDVSNKRNLYKHNSEQILINIGDLLGFLGLINSE